MTIAIQERIRGERQRKPASRTNGNGRAGGVRGSQDQDYPEGNMVYVPELAMRMRLGGTTWAPMHDRRTGQIIDTGVSIGSFQSREQPPQQQIPCAGRIVSIEQAGNGVVRAVCQDCHNPLFSS